MTTEQAGIEQVVERLTRQVAEQQQVIRRQMERINRLTATLTMVREMASEALESQSRSQSQGGE